MLKVKEQVVAGKLYYLTLEAIDVGHKKWYEAKVWVKPWTNFKQLEEFKHAESDLSFTPSDLGVIQGNGLTLVHLHHTIMLNSLYIWYFHIGVTFTIGDPSSLH